MHLSPPSLPPTSSNFVFQIRRDTAEFLYVMLQGTDIGRDTDDVEDILLETEWYVIPFLYLLTLTFWLGLQMTYR